MDPTGFGPSDPFLRTAAEKHFGTAFDKPKIKIGQEIDAKLGWTPSLFFSAKQFVIIAAEVSERPYPMILRIRHANIVNVHVPIIVYSVCPEEAFLRKEAQKEVEELKSHGFGLLTVNEAGEVNKRHGCIPLIQHISEDEMTLEIKVLPKAIRLRFKEAFDVYQGSATSGVQEASEIVEDLVNGAIKHCVKTGLLKPDVLKVKSAAIAVDHLFTIPKLKNKDACHGGLRYYISTYRNKAHHAPKTKADAYKKSAYCRDGFKGAVDHSKSLCDELKKAGIPARLGSQTP